MFRREQDGLEKAARERIVLLIGRVGTGREHSRSVSNGPRTNRSCTIEVPIDVWIVAVVTAVLILLAVGIHYEILNLTSNGLRGLKLSHRIRVVLAVLAALSAHFLEVILFAVGWKILLAAGEVQLSIEDPTFIELLYFSASTYTSLGYGDIVPIADSGILAGSEALAGLVLIAWTASFTFFVMQAFWDDDDSH